MATVSQEKPSWVTNIEKQRAQAGLPTVSSGSSNTSSSGTSKGISGSSTSTTGSVVKSSGSSGGTVTSSSGTSGGSSVSASSYTPAGAGSDYYAGQKMSGSDQALLKSYGDNWNAATTQEEKDYWHDKAEELRTSYGYQGGTDGSQYIDLMQQPLQSAQQNSGYDLSSYLRQIYANQLESELAGLKVAYEKSMAGYDDQAAGLPQQYDAARNSVAAQDALAKKAFDERAAASGLSSGAAGQAELARSSAYQRDIASLDQAQADALSDIDLAKTNLQSQYENAIAQARAEGNAALANALYEELVRVQGLNREDEQIAAERELAELELAMKYAAKDSSGSTTGTKTGGGDKQSGDKQPEETGMSWSNVEDWYNKYGATSAKNYVRENYKAMGYTSVSTALAGWENYLVSRKDVAVTESVSNPAAHDWVFVPGYGRLTWKELNDYVDAGKIMKSYNSETGKYTYTMNRSQTNGKPENDLTGTGQNLYYQLQSIPGLTSENKVAMIEDALNNRRITETDANWLLNYLGY